MGSKAKRKGARKKEEAAAKSDAAKKLEHQLSQLSGEIDRFATRAKEAIAKTDQESERILKDLNDKRNAARQELARLADKGDTALQDLTGGFEKAVRDLDKAIRKALGRFSGQ